MASTDLMLLYRIASLYYREGKTQEEISAQENISRSQISRLLEKAREQGVVRIDVALPHVLESGPLTDFLKTQLKLERLILAPVEDEWDAQRISESVARTGAEWLPRLLRGARVIGLGWGETMYRMAATLRRRVLGGEPVFVPLIGASGSTNPFLQINTILDRVSESMEGDRFFANLPAFREKNIPLTTYENKRLSMLHDYWDQVDTAVFGLGTRDSSRGSFDEEVSQASQERIMKTEVVGDILSQFFFPDGSILPPDESYHSNAYKAERLKSLPRTICMAGGEAKVEALIAAARGGYFKTLVTDVRTAELIYERIRRNVTV